MNGCFSVAETVYAAEVRSDWKQESLFIIWVSSRRSRSPSSVEDFAEKALRILIPVTDMHCSGEGSRVGGGIVNPSEPWNPDLYEGRGTVYLP